jgi:hypothetical protein
VVPLKITSILGLLSNLSWVKVKEFEIQKSLFSGSEFNHSSPFAKLTAGGD